MLKCPIKLASIDRPDQIAILDQDSSLTYKQLDLEIEKCAYFLKIHRGKIASICQNSIDLIILLFASFRAHVPIFLLNPTTPLSVLKNLQKQLSITHLFSDYKLPIKSTQIKDLISLSSKRDIEYEIDEEHLATIIYTSGSTSDPKLACHRYENHFLSAKKISSILNIEQNDRYLLCLPLTHVAGIATAFRTFVSCAMLVIENKQISLFDNLRLQKITHVSMVSTQLYRLIQENDCKNLNLKCILLGGGPISPNLYTEAVMLGLPIYVTYGLTELTSSVLITQKPVFADSTLYYGKPIFNDSALLSNLSEILCKGPSLFKGYLQEDGSFDLPITPSGYFATKDLGYYSKEYGYSIIGRKDNLFISGGENIQPEEIERALLALDGVYHAIVIPIDDKEFGTKPVAFILHRDKKFCLEKIKEKLENNLLKFKIPKQIYNLSDLPPTCMKYKKNDLKKLII